jgi:short-subunit dehydrogenase
MPTFKAVTLITGASSGIGAALARIFAENGHEIALVARREPSLAALADEIAASGGQRPHVLSIDLARADAAARLSHDLRGRGLEPEIVVNSAGFGLFGRAAELDRDEQLAMIDLNIRALTDLSLRFVESLARHRGGLLNVASIAGFVPAPRMAVYHATKAYAVAFGEALHCELAPRGVRVTTLCSGPVETEFQPRAGLARGQYPRGLTRAADRVARDGYRGFVNGQRVVIPGFGNKLVVGLARFLPRTFILRSCERILDHAAHAVVER